MRWAAFGVIFTALLGCIASQQVPPAPPQTPAERLDLNSAHRLATTLIRSTLHDRRVFLAIMAISFFWTIGAVLVIQFPPLAKNVLGASKEVASLFLVMFSVGSRLGSVAINALLQRQGLGAVLAAFGDRRWRCSWSLSTRSAARWQPDPNGDLLNVARVRRAPADGAACC